MDKYCKIKIYGHTYYEVRISLLINGADKGKSVLKWALIYTELPPETVCEGTGETAFYHALEQPYLLARRI